LAVRKNYTGDPCPHLEAEKSKVKVTTSFNAEMDNALYLPTGKAYELQTW